MAVRLQDTHPGLRGWGLQVMAHLFGPKHATLAPTNMRGAGVQFAQQACWKAMARLWHAGTCAVIAG